MSMIREAVVHAALVALHKQLRSTAEVRLSIADFDYHDLHQEDAIALDFDESNGDVILRHKSPKNDA